jgi:hypothetical protein
LTITGVVVVEAIGVCDKMHVNTIGLVDDESALALTVISDMELFLDIL